MICANTFANQSVDIIEGDENLSPMMLIYKQIELAGRVSYKSEDKITENSALKFVKRMIENKHYAVLEHGTVYLKADYDLLKHYKENHYSVLNTDSNWPHSNVAYVTTNYRVIIENGWEEDLKYICRPTENHELRFSVKFTTTRQVANEFVRHRVFSFMQESTRYCNYSKDKFNNTITFIRPYFKFNESDDEVHYERILNDINTLYMNMINHGHIPQEVAGILPLCTKTELVMTGFLKDWNHFFELRALGSTGKPHPQAEEIAKEWLKKMVQKNFIKQEENVSN